MNCPECGSDNIHEQGTIIYRSKITKWEGDKAIEHDSLTEWLYDTSEADCFWCGNCTLEFEPTPEG